MVVQAVQVAQAVQVVQVVQVVQAVQVAQAVQAVQVVQDVQDVTHVRTDLNLLALDIVQFLAVAVFNIQNHHNLDDMTIVIL